MHQTTGDCDRHVIRGGSWDNVGWLCRAACRNYCDPGDRIYRVGYPSKEGRKRTYEGYLNKVNHEITPEQVDRMATITPYATGATIKDVVNEEYLSYLGHPATPSDISYYTTAFQAGETAEQLAVSLLASIGRRSSTS